MISSKLQGFWREIHHKLILDQLVLSIWTFESSVSHWGKNEHTSTSILKKNIDVQECEQNTNKSNQRILMTA